MSSYWPAGQGSFQGAFYLHGQLLIRQWERGLLRMENDDLVLVPQGERWANERIYSMLPYDEHQIEAKNAFLSTVSHELRTPSPR